MLRVANISFPKEKTEIFMTKMYKRDGIICFESLKTGRYSSLLYYLKFQCGSTKNSIFNNMPLDNTTKLINTGSLGVAAYTLKRVNKNDRWAFFVSLTKMASDYFLKTPDTIKRKFTKIYYLISHAVQETFNSVLGNIFANFKNHAI